MSQGAADELWAAVARVVQQRRTEKVCVDPDDAVAVPEAVAAKRREQVLESLRLAGMAPFHYPRQVDGLAEPWRAHVLFDAATRDLALYLRDNLGISNKLPKLAAGCGALVLVTWLPESTAGDAADASAAAKARRTRDEEHLAAASAMVQNLLLLLTARGLGTYWSSGGQLKDAEVYQRLGIDLGERLLAAVFIDYPELAHPEAKRTPGKLRDARTDTWFREVPL